MAPGQAKVLIMHRKLSKDKVLHIEELWHSSQGFAALLEGNLIEADKGVGERSTFTSPCPRFSNMNSDRNQSGQ